MSIDKGFKYIYVMITFWLVIYPASIFYVKFLIVVCITPPLILKKIKHKSNVQ